MFKGIFMRLIHGSLSSLINTDLVVVYCSPKIICIIFNLLVKFKMDAIWPHKFVLRSHEFDLLYFLGLVSRNGQVKLNMYADCTCIGTWQPTAKICGLRCAVNCQNVMSLSELFPLFFHYIDFIFDTITIRVLNWCDTAIQSQIHSNLKFTD